MESKKSILPVGETKAARIQYRLDAMYGVGEVEYLTNSRKYKCCKCGKIGKFASMWKTRTFPCGCANAPTVRICGDSCYIQYDYVEKQADSVFEQRLTTKFPKLLDKTKFISRYDTVEVSPCINLHARRAFNVPAFIGYHAVVDWMTINLHKVSNAHLKYIHNAYVKMKRMFPEKKVYLYVFAFEPSGRKMVQGKFIVYPHKRLIRICPKSFESKYKHSVDFNNAAVRRFGLSDDLLQTKALPRQPSPEVIKHKQEVAERRRLREEKKQQKIQRKIEREKAIEYRNKLRLASKIARILKSSGRTVKMTKKKTFSKKTITKFTEEIGFARMQMLKKQKLRQMERDAASASKLTQKSK